MGIGRPRKYPEVETSLLKWMKDLFENESQICPHLLLAKASQMDSRIKPNDPNVIRWIYRILRRKKWVNFILSVTYTIVYCICIE
jgi:hypothetical protein